MEAQPKKLREAYLYAKAQRNTRKYRNRRRAFLAANPLCEICHQNGKTVAATQLDHIIPVVKSPELFWDAENWQALCIDCHKEKTAGENMRWQPDATYLGLEAELRRLIDETETDN